MQMQQQLELESAHQRNASNILSSLATRGERLRQEKNGLAMPDASHLENLRYQLEEKQQLLEETGMALEEALAQQPRLEEERRAAQAAVQG